jgi:NAD+ diphosphatase
MPITYKYCPQCSAPLETRLIDGAERKACTSAGCTFVYWNNPIPVVVIIPEVPEGIILARNVKWPKGVFSVISGFIEAGESPGSAAVRELKEELGLHALHVNLIGNFIFHKMNQLIIAYHVVATGDVRLNDELDEIKVVQKHQLAGWQRTQRFEVGEWLNKLKILEEE